MIITIKPVEEATVILAMRLEHGLASHLKVNPSGRRIENVSNRGIDHRLAGHVAGASLVGD
jgi:hypothetical protein